MDEELVLVLSRDQMPSDQRHFVGLATFRGDKLILICDALRFARDNFLDENGLQLSLEENATLQEVIDVLEEHIQS